MRKRIVIYNSLRSARDVETDGFGETTAAARKLIDRFVLMGLSRSEALQTLMAEGFSTQTATRIAAAYAAKLLTAHDGVGSPEEIAYGEGWHSSSGANPYESAEERAAWEKGRAAKRLKQKSGRGETRGTKFVPPKPRSLDYKTEKGFVAKLLDPTSGRELARSEPHISNGPGLKKWVQEKARELVQSGKRVRAEVVVVFFDPVKGYDAQL